VKGVISNQLRDVTNRLGRRNKWRGNGGEKKMEKNGGERTMEEQKLK